MSKTIGLKTSNRWLSTVSSTYSEYSHGTAQTSTHLHLCAKQQRMHCNSGRRPSMKLVQLHQHQHKTRASPCLITCLQGHHVTTAIPPLSDTNMLCLMNAWVLSGYQSGWRPSIPNEYRPYQRMEMDGRLVSSFAYPATRFVWVGGMAYLIYPLNYSRSIMSCII